MSDSITKVNSQMFEAIWEKDVEVDLSKDPGIGYAFDIENFYKRELESYKSMMHVEGSTALSSTQQYDNEFWVEAIRNLEKKIKENRNK